MLFSFFLFAHADPFLDAQVTGFHTSAQFLDDEQTQQDDMTWLRSRIRAGYSVTPHKNWFINTQFEIANARIAGDFSTLGLDVHNDLFRVQQADRSDLLYILPRDLSIRYSNETWGWNVGIQSFTWGLGILSNDGNQESRFGMTYQGNTYARASIFSLPTTNNRGLMLFAATDLILRDDNAFIYEGDTAAQAIIGAQLIQKNLRGGILAGARFQQDPEDPNRPVEQATSFAVPVDAYIQYSPTSNIRLEAEGVYVWGKTDRIYSESTRGETSTIGYYGGITRASHTQKNFLSGSLNSILELGYASGDGHPTDSKASGFSFHSDYNVGLLLYDTVLPQLHARSMERIIDPDLTHIPPSGLRYGVPQGGVHNSMYFQLCSTWEKDNFLMRMGWLHAYSATPLQDAYHTGISGGYANNFEGTQATESALGNEFNLRLQHQTHKNLRFIADGGYFLPSQALSILEPSWMLMAQAQLTMGTKQ